MNRLPLRWVVLLPLLATITLGFLVFALYVDHSDRTARIAAIDKELARAERADPAAPSPGSQDGEGAPPPALADPTTVGLEPPVHLVLDDDGGVTATSGAANPFAPTALAELAATSRRTFVEVADHRVLVSPRPDGQVTVTALSLEGFRAATAALRRTLVLGGLILVGLESAMAWWLAGRLARPLTTMAATANRIADGALDTEVRPAAGSRELSNLSRDLERMVSRLRESLAERERSEAVATRSRDDMRRFLADVSHEIRTPLTALKGYSDLYAKGMLTEPGSVDRAMSRVGSESVRLHSLVSSMLQLVGSPDSRVRVVRDVDLVDLVRAVRDDLRAAHPGRQVDVVVDHDVDPSLGVRVAGDPDRLHQAVLNLGSNACTHTPAQSSVTLRVVATTTTATVGVVDHGAGIDGAEAEEIFLPFYRTDPSRTRNGSGGAGLGLAITRQVAEEHRGSVEVSLTPGGGATFALRLPRLTEPSAAAR